VDCNEKEGDGWLLGGVQPNGQAAQSHEGRRAFSIFQVDPPSMEPCRGEHTARARIPDFGRVLNTNFHVWTSLSRRRRFMGITGSPLPLALAIRTGRGVNCDSRVRTPA
jgi:hypothetical protein